MLEFLEGFWVKPEAPITASMKVCHSAGHQGRPYTLTSKNIICCGHTGLSGSVEQHFRGLSAAELV